MNANSKNGSPAPQKIVPVDNSHFKRSELANGLKVVSEKIPYVRSATVGAWVLNGSRNEKPAENGVSHFIEHMLFKGTSRHSAFQIAEAIEKVGGVLNAFTGKELTCYYAHVLDEDLPLAVRLLAEILTQSTFTPEDIQNEKEVVLEEIKEANEQPDERIHEYFFQDLFGTHSLSLPILGTAQTISNLSRPAVRRYFREHYTQGGIVLAAAGNIDHEALCELVATSLAALAPSCSRAPSVSPNPAHFVKKRFENTLQSHICMGGLALPFADERKYSALVLNTLLGGGMSSRLFQLVREKHALCYNIYSYLEFFADTGIFCIYTATDPKNTAMVVELIERELDLLRTGHLAEVQVENAKSQLKGGLMLGLEDTSSRMNRIAKMEIYLNRYYSLDDVIRGIERVTIDDVSSIARQLFNPNGLVTSILSSNH